MQYISCHPRMFYFIYPSGAGPVKRPSFLACLIPAFVLSPLLSFSISGAIPLEEKGYKEIPIMKKISAEMVEENYKQVRREIFKLLRDECGKLSIKQMGPGQSKTKGSAKGKMRDDWQSVSY